MKRALRFLINYNRLEINKRPENHAEAFAYAPANCLNAKSFRNRVLRAL